MLSQKKWLLIGVAAIAILIIPITVSELQKEQETRSRASSSSPVTLSLSPSSKLLAVGESFTSQLLMQTESNDVSGVDITLKFDRNILEIISFAPTSVFNTSLLNTPSNENGTLRYAAVNTSANPITGDGIELGTIAFRAIDSGTSTVSFERVQATGTGQSQALAMGVHINATYIVGQSATPIPSATPAPTEFPDIPVPTTASTPTSTPPTPTAPPVILSPTPIPGGVRATFSILLQGISGNIDARSKNQQLEITVINTQGSEVAVVNNTIVYDAKSQAFSGVVDFGTRVPPGDYTLKIKIKKYLRKIIPGIFTFSPNTDKTLPTVTLAVGDINGDNTISIQDYNVIVGCFRNKAQTSSCAGKEDDADLDTNGAVDGIDYNLFLRSLGAQEGD